MTHSEKVVAQGSSRRNKSLIGAWFGFNNGMIDKDDDIVFPKSWHGENWASGNNIKKIVHCEMLPEANALARREIERRVIEDGTAIWRTKKKYDMEVELKERKELRDMLAVYNPWGKPGNGAPMPGALRKTKWVFQEPLETVASVMTLGRPGHGAPLRTISGKIKTLIKSDPSIRFQNNESSRRSVENDLRYRATPADKENYRRELDAIVKEKQHKRKQDGAEKSKGWTDDAAFGKLASNFPKGEDGDGGDCGGGGVELVPLLARNRTVNRSPLTSTDVTRISKMESGVGIDEEYQRHLSKQVNERQNTLMEERREDAETSRKHFETWKGFWGRPGHGAPKGPSQREKLDMILYYVPKKRNPSPKIKQ